MSARPVEIHKFGGTSVGSAERIEAVAELIAERVSDAQICVVSSAMTKVTDHLVKLVELGRESRQEREEHLRWVREHHLGALGSLELPDHDEVEGRVTSMLDELEALSAPLGLFHLPPPALCDRVQSMGERLAVELVAGALRKRGVPATPMHADSFLETAASFGESEPSSYTDDRRTAAALRAVMDDGRVPVVTGFMGRGPDGDTRLLGRGGSDLSAALLASALNADELVIWTDVEGVRTCDPRLVPDAEPIERLHYREAAEMAFFGSKVLHQRVMLPVAGKNIPVRVRSTMNPRGAHTLIDGSFDDRGSGYAVSVMRPVALVSLEGGGFAGVVGISARLFDALADAAISVVMISQGSSESSICLGVREQDAERAETAIRNEFRLDLGRGMVDDVVVRRHAAIVTAVGAGMRHRVGAAAAMTSAMARSGVNILAIAQGSSELSVSFAIESADVPRAANALHGLGRGTSGLRVALVGAGNVGAQVARCMAAHPRHRLVAIADSRGFVTNGAGLDVASVDRVIAHKQAGGSLADGDVDGATGAPADLLRHFEDPSSLVLVDCTASGSMTGVARHALAAGVHVVTANKEILACDADTYTDMMREARRTSTQLLGESTVGAGLPIASTIRSIIGAGDEVLRIEAALSGTIALILERLAAGETLPTIIEDAVARGFAEPDPREDVLGRDMTRKAIILGRLAGLAADDVAVEPFAPMPTGDVTDPDTRAALEQAGADIDARIRAASAQNREIRYLAAIDRVHGATLRLEEIAADHPLARLGGGESGAAIWTRLNGERPIVVRGSGAGAGPTAFGIMSDLATIASLEGTP